MRRQTLHPDVEIFARKVASVTPIPIASMTPVRAREWYEEIKPTDRSGPEMETISDAWINSNGRSKLIREYVPSSHCNTSIVYFHSGGWVLGSVEMADVLARYIATILNCRVFSVDYSLAPEHPFPAAVEDTCDAVRWIHDQQGGKGKIVLMGDSAGGNLVATTALRLRDEGDSPVSAQVMIYPVVDHDFSRPSYHEKFPACTMSSDDMAWFWLHYIPEVQVRSTPYASPLHARDLGGLPEAFIATAEFDVLRDEGLEYAKRLTEAGVHVEYRCYKGTVHGFLSIPEKIQPARDLIEDCAQFLRVRGHLD